jgi:G6PDH family F420-dependent oxidoreductase
MLEEAIDVIRLLWKGDVQSHRGSYYTVDSARIYNLPPELPPIMIAARGARATKLAATLGDGLIVTAPDQDHVRSFREAGGNHKSVYGKLTVCWAKTEEQARETAHRQWPNAGMGSYIQDLRLPEDFEEVSTLVNEEDVTAEVLCSPDPARHIAALREYFDAGFDTVFVHQIGPDQEGFMRIYEREVLPTFGSVELVAGGARNANGD